MGRLSDTDAAYIAGLIDGEGTIALTRMHSRENRRPCVSIANTDLALLQYAREAAGCGIVTPKRTTKPHHTPSYVWRCVGRQALQLLAEVHPYLKTYKRARSALLIERYIVVTPRNGKYTLTMREAKTKFERDFHSIPKAG